MFAHSAQTKEQELYLRNIEAARKAGVDIGKTGKAVYEAILAGLSYVNFPGTSWEPVSLTSEYLSDLFSILYDRAVEQGKADIVKWVGLEK